MPEYESTGPSKLLMILAEGLTKTYGDLTALDDVGFAAEPGQVIGVLGLNGAGKSTLLRILAGELVPSAGRVVIGEAELESDPRAVRAQIGYLPEEPPLYREMRVRDFLAFVGALHGVAAQRIDGRLAEVAEQTHIADQLDRILGELSMGYRKRVGIAQAIVHDPAVVILDELVSSLDPAEIVGMRELIRSLVGDRERIVFTSSHNLNEVRETCDRILVLHHGALVAQGTQEELGALRGQERVEVEVLDPHGKLPTVLPRGMELVSAAPLGDGVSEGIVDLGGGEREALVARLVEARLGVRRLEVHRSDLEKIFLGLVAGGPR